VTGRRRIGVFAVLGVAAAFFVAGCGGGGGGEKGDGKGGGGPSATMVSDLPLQGSSRPQNETIVNAITLALEERDYMAGDVQIEYISQDNATAQAGKWDEAKCAENAQSAAQNEEVVGWIGPFNSGCAQVEIPILNQAGLAMVSPANTYIGLTKLSPDPSEPEKFYPTGIRNYTRVIVADDKQGRAGAVWMRDLGVQSVYILDDQETYGKGLADQFQQSAQELGIQVLGREGIDGNAANYRSLMAQIAQLQPDAIYFGGITQNNAGQLVSDKVGAGMSNENVIFMGPDGIYEEEFLSAAGNAAEGIYVTFGGLPASELPGPGQDFVQNYRDRFGGDVEAYTAYGYEAANVLLDAIQRAYEADGEVTRAGVVRELFATRYYSGVLGTWSFDGDGDTTLTDLSGQRVQDGEFQFDRTIDVGGP
jgi:branched-chain amino acid transport system substrate-binding protein